MTQNIALKNGLIINGAGSPGYFGTVLIRDNKISILRGNQEYPKPDFEIDCKLIAALSPKITLSTNLS